jgi:adenosylcobinamide kinase/adenosylcobinamide-phosphate guanylyltransferase
MLAVLTGPVRSGKSREGLRLAHASGARVVMAVGGTPDDEEMTRRIERHRAERDARVSVLETAGDPGWRDRVPEDACLLVDCLGTVLGTGIAALVPAGLEVLDDVTERDAERLADDLVAWLAGRGAPTVVVTNETGWDVVPATSLGRLFRDVMGRANRTLVDSADAAWLMIAGRALPLDTLTLEVSWPKER